MELTELQRLWELPNAFVVVYGRRRVGKTRLIEEFLKNKKGIRFTAEDVQSRIQIREFQKRIADFFNDDFLKDQEITSWRALLTYLGRAASEKIYVWIDEFSYVLKNDRSAASAFQIFIDQYVRKSEIFFIVSGSLFGIMSEKILSASSPLYGRRTKDFLIRPLDFRAAREFLKKWSFEDQLKAYLSIGGIPEYLLVARRYGSFDSFLAHEFLQKDGYFYREPYFLLSQEFKEIKTYFSILHALSAGNTRPTEIANFVGIKTREIYPYLDILISYNFVRRISNFLNQKQGIYVIDDPFFDAWFNLVYPFREEIEHGIVKLPNRTLNGFLAKRFELFILNLFSKFFGVVFTKAWRANVEIDLIEKDNQEHPIVGEVKWRSDMSAPHLAKDLLRKADSIGVIPGRLLLVAKSFARRISELDGVPVECVDLNDLRGIVRSVKTNKNNVPHK